MNIKPIETIYKGYRFRSRLEARWAVFFDALGIEWEYEKEGYDLGELGWYLPDFEIETDSYGKWFVEVKGNKNDTVGIRKAQFLDDYCGSEFMGCRVFGPLETLDNENRVYATMLCVSVSDYNRAIIKARQARFEHGEIALCKF
ncbi:hypothetical protein [Bacillus cereus]|uniref:hypothetical protein n=1 Tax=Bacillus cereus TaxID=1396 RepID=UPI000BEE509F|nr:hypothetical protein [Bacillus cereus]PEF63182.1 hypothetical protein CON35_18845 [Bacillus cereus]